MPIAGALVWVGIGIAGAVLPLAGKVWAIWLGTGMIFYVGIGVARLIGEDLFGRTRPSNHFDRIFLLTVVQAVSVYAIAIPFFLVEPTSLPMSVGILTGLMWVPFSGLIRHWVGLFHGLTRTAGVLIAWYLLPDLRFVAIPAVIVATYAATILILHRRYRRMVAAGA
ncbi:MAG: hypothetical protein WBA12_13100 [Catalinimonas sp.]